MNFKVFTFQSQVFYMNNSFFISIIAVMKYILTFIIPLSITYSLAAQDFKDSGVINWKIKTPSKVIKARKLRSSVDERLDALNYLNEIRTAAGLDAYTSNSSLDNAAENHAQYLTYHNLFSHYEDEDNYPDLYTGVYPLDRGEYEGYEYKYYGENLSAGDSNIYESIDGLISAIYHRFGFLDFKNNEIGIGSSYDEDYTYKSVYNFDMGNQTTTINTELKYILWPYKNSERFQTSFNNTEYPAPLPECKTGGIAGNPISIEFNPAQNDAITMKSFKLFKDDATEITNVKDPSSVENLNENQFVLFPMNSLSLDSKYSVEFKYTENDEEKSISWSFRTRRYEYKRYEVFDGGSYDVIDSETYLIHLKHNDCNVSINSWELSGDATLEYINSDLFKITVRSDSTLDFNSGTFVIDFNISSTDTAIKPSSKSDILDMYIMGILPAITAYKKANP